MTEPTTPPTTQASTGGAWLPVSASSMPWAISPDALPLPLSLPATGPDAVSRETSEIAAGVEDPMVSRAGAVVVLRADGIILPRCASWLESYGYVTSAEGLAGRVEAAAAADAAAIMICFDSPGGSVSGVAEAAARIAAVARGTLVVAVADHLMASAAYFLASGCTAIVASPSAMVGSIGVIAVRPSIARALDAEGVDIDVLTRGEGKTDHLVVVALTDEGRKRLQASVDAFYEQFVAAVAAGRGVPKTTVSTVWGAQVLTAEAARQAGMVNAVSDARGVFAKLSTEAGRRQYRQRARLDAIIAATRPEEAPDA